MYTLEELWLMARTYGRVNIFTADNGTYSCNIKFNTIEHTELVAHSGHNHKHVADALKAAITSAEAIVKSVSDIKLDPARKLLKG